MLIPLGVACAAASVPSTGTYLRLAVASTGSIALQTATVRLSLRERDTRRPFTVDMFSTVHLADAPYYEALQSQCESNYDRVLFELITDEENTRVDADGTRRLCTPIRATPALRETARVHALSAQADVLDCTRARWVLADAPRAEVLCQQLPPDARDFRARAADAIRSGVGTVLGGPSAASWAARTLRRPALLLLPAPEVALLLDDWVGSGGAVPARALAQLAAALATLDIRTARRLAFAQTLAQGETTQRTTAAAESVRARNALAVDGVGAARRAGCDRIALVYGALHMRDLRSRLERNYELTDVSAPRWRTAWRISRKPPAAAGAAAEPPTAAIAATLAALAILAVDGADWLDTAAAILTSLVGALPDPAATDPFAPFSPLLGAAEAAAAASLYLVRHGLIYLAISRWAFDWERRWYLGDDADGDDAADAEL